MSDKTKSVTQAIKRNINILNSVVLLIVFTLFFLNVKYLYETINYIPAFSIVSMLTIVSGLVLMSLYLARIISRNAIKEIEEYDNQLNSLLISTKLEINERREAEDELKRSHSTILQQEKMASIGQLAAGVAHEINNPMGFISSNLGILRKYAGKLAEFIKELSQAAGQLNGKGPAAGLKEKRNQLKIDYILDDIEPLIKESLEGADRVKTIVQNLKTFSRVDEAEYKHADINECIESTLNIVWNELKYKSTVEKNYEELPLTKCYPQQLNQVFMNLLVNAAQAIEKQGVIKIKTWNVDGLICISISDTGIGIPEDKISKIFEPFFTTKEIGKGTGLGLSIAYDIMKKHNGDINVDSEVGKGTIFNIKIPVVEGT
jgi:two-component system NtrC family sensor kinase